MIEKVLRRQAVREWGPATSPASFPDREKVFRAHYLIAGVCSYMTIYNFVQLKIENIPVATAGKYTVATDQSC